MCVRYHGSAAGGLGSDPISTEWKTAIVVDSCPDCKKGDLDFGAKKDGRWGIEWYAIPCPVGTSNVQYAFEGSNKWYLKVQVRNTLVPVKAVAICTQGTQCKALTRANDNHFLAQGAGFSTPFPVNLELRLKSVTDEVVMDTISVPNLGAATSASPITGTVQFTNAPGSIRGKRGFSTRGTVQFRNAPGSIREGSSTADTASDLYYAYYVVNDPNLNLPSDDTDNELLNGSVRKCDLASSTRCGPQNGGKICDASEHAEPLYCSQFGWCGAGVRYMYEEHSDYDSSALEKCGGLVHQGEDCWHHCENQSGICSWCGSGKCCRQGFQGDNGCCAKEEGGATHHECVSR
eukprot:GEMP01031984.1.p1 GENE.GEMP01031984.1~~GEMP01031984.1.p1  ORF type:complete len:347 (+),score=68.14 GEMP01031984.1:411-1451(+)